MPDASPVRILYVDDEELSLKYFRKAFEGRHAIATAIDGQEALRLLARPDHGVGVLISDQRMPGMLGTSLLATVRERFPDIVRILTTAHTDLAGAIAAVNEGQVWHYAVKPWQVPELGVVLDHAVERYQISRERRLLLEEKIHTLQRFIVEDRVRSYAILAKGLASRIRNPVHALKAFIECAPFPRAVEMSDGSVEWRELLEMAKRTSVRTLDIIQGVVDQTCDPAVELASLDLGVLVQGVLDDAGAWDRRDLAVVCCLDAEDLRLQGDAKLLIQLFAALLRRLSCLIGRGRTIAVTCVEGSVLGQDALEVQVRSPDGRADDAGWRRCFGPSGDASSAEMDLLTAFFIAFHHGGDVVIDRGEQVLRGGAGAGFTVRLPRRPVTVNLPAIDQAWQQRLFTHFPALLAGA